MRPAELRPRAPLAEGRPGPYNRAQEELRDVFALTAGHLIVLLVGILLIVWGAVALRRSAERQRRDEALEILRSRFARGEIGQAEYEQRRQLLRR